MPAEPLSPTATSSAADPLRPPPPPGWRDRLAALGQAAGVELSRRDLVLGALVAVVAIALAAGAFLLLRPPAGPPPELNLPMASTAPAGPGAPSGPAGQAPAGGTEGATPPAPDEIVVHAAGAVRTPGLYRLAPGARADDVVAAAGGPAPDAELERLNLAAPVTDGQRVYVPRAGEEVPVEVAAGAPGGDPGVGLDRAAAAPVDLNAASAAELDTLPGVGPATASAIIAYREANGGFRSVDELVEVRGIGDVKLAELRDLVAAG